MKERPGVVPEKQKKGFDEADINASNNFDEIGSKTPNEEGKEDRKDG